MIYLSDRQPEVVKADGFTPKAIDQVNRATALIEEVEKKDNDLSESDEMDREQVRNDFIAFSSLLYRNSNNPDFRQFAENPGFSSLFNVYRERNEDLLLMNFFVRIANRKDLISEWLKKAENCIKQHVVVVDEGYEPYLRNTYNTISDMLIVEGTDQ